MHLPIVVSVALALAPSAGKPPSDRAASQVDGERDVAAVIARFKEKDPRMAKAFEQARGYAVFPTVRKGGIGIGGARDKGHVYERGRLVGRSTLTQ